MVDAFIVYTLSTSYGELECFFQIGGKFSLRGYWLPLLYSAHNYRANELELSAMKT